MWTDFGAVMQNRFGHHLQKPSGSQDNEKRREEKRREEKIREKRREEKRETRDEKRMEEKGSLVYGLHPISGCFTPDFQT